VPATGASPTLPLSSRQWLRPAMALIALLRISIPVWHRPYSAMFTLGKIG